MRILLALAILRLLVVMASGRHSGGRDRGIGPDMAIHIPTPRQLDWLYSPNVRVWLGQRTFSTVLREETCRILAEFERREWSRCADPIPEPWTTTVIFAARWRP